MDTALDTIKSLAEKTARELGFKVYDCRWTTGSEGPELVVEVDRKGFIDLEGITIFSEKLSPLLDDIAELNFPYTLNCQSADAERAIDIAELADYEGSYVEVVTSEDVHAVGEYQLTGSDEITVKTFIKGKPKKWTIAISDIKTINLRVKI